MSDGGLERFVRAQDPVMETVRAELRAGAKRSHWMWFVFPQLTGLGRSETARRYGIGSSAEAKLYGAHPVLGARLVECTELVLSVRGRTVGAIFGSPDDMKFHSSMTLFGRASEGTAVFGEAIGRCFGGVEDGDTVRLLAG